jgi:Tfp pilus assembly major pilin PilA
MNPHNQSKQSGMSFIGLLFVGGLLAVLGVVAVQVVPTLIELQAINKAVMKARDGNTPTEIRTLFDRAAAVDDIKSITGKDLDVSPAGEKVVIRFAYQREIHLAGPAYLTLKYSGSSQ